MTMPDRLRGLKPLPSKVVLSASGILGLWTLLDTMFVHRQLFDHALGWAITAVTVVGGLAQRRVERRQNDR
jgi:hypothetical protein